MLTGHIGAFHIRMQKMKIHNYLEEVLGSRVKIKVIRAMLRFPDKKFSVRELAKFVGVTHTPILRSLDELQGMNLINVERHGQSDILTFNKNCYLYNALKSLFEQEQKTKNDLIQLIKSHLKSAQTIVLFGSMQKGTETLRSDIDLLIVTSEKNKMTDEVQTLNSKLAKEFGNVVSQIILTEKQFRSKKNKAFAKTLINNYLVIKGKDLVRRYWL